MPRLTSYGLIAAVCLLFSSTYASGASATRKPTPAERAALTQAVFDVLPSVEATSAIPGTKVSGVSVSTKSPKFPAATKFYYRTFAAVSVDNARVGGAVLLFGFYVARISGWKLLSGPGSSGVGCDVSDAIFHGFKAIVLRDLGLYCH
jgi:hypothetical protein